MSRHSNDLSFVLKQLERRRLTLMGEERPALIASIERGLAEIDSRRAKADKPG
jgi:hypothetical protein